jgi:PhnB protein
MTVSSFAIALPGGGRPSPRHSQEGFEMPAARTNATNEAQIRAVIDAWTHALRAKDVGGVLAHYSPDVVQFDMAPPLEYAGTDALKTGLTEWFSTWHGSIGYEIRDLSITAGDEVAFSLSLNRLSGKKTSGEKSEVWFRHTLCFRKIGGEWKIAHAHESVPFYMDGSYRAAVDLRP